MIEALFGAGMALLGVAVGYAMGYAEGKRRRRPDRDMPTGYDWEDRD